MLTVRKRGRVFHADLLAGDTRIRGSLGTGNEAAVRRITHKLEIALSEGSSSTLWTEIKNRIPRLTYLRFANTVGVKDHPVPNWHDLHESFELFLNQRISIGKLQHSTANRYKITLREFESFLAENQISVLQEISRRSIESFKVWRMGRIKKRKFARGGTSLALDLAILHRIFAFALENEMVVKNVIKMEGKPGENPQHGAEPFSSLELLKLRENAGEDLLSFLLLRWTGFRGSDAVSLTWNEIRFDEKEIERVTQKRKKKVSLPIQTELFFALESAFETRKPKLSERVLLNPRTGNPLTRPRLYHRMLALGKRATVPNAHPHRFRDTLAVDMLARGASPYDVAKMLGDTIETVEKHYTPFVKELRERVRSILENGTGLEYPVTPTSQSHRSN
jgi:site-specific recombinase XerD